MPLALISCLKTTSAKESISTQITFCWMNLKYYKDFLYTLWSGMSISWSYNWTKKHTTRMYVANHKDCTILHIMCLSPKIWHVVISITSWNKSMLNCAKILAKYFSWDRCILKIFKCNFPTISHFTFFGQCFFYGSQ